VSGRLALDENLQKRTGRRTAASEQNETQGEGGGGVRKAEGKFKGRGLLSPKQDKAPSTGWRRVKGSVIEKSAVGTITKKGGVRVVQKPLIRAKL